MKRLLFSMATSAVMVLSTASANAAVTLDGGSVAGNLTGYTTLGLTLVNDFNSGTLASNGITGNAALVTGSSNAQYQAPTGDLSQYLVVPETTAPYVPVGASPFKATVGLGQVAVSVGFYWGSPDSYNNLVELLSGGSVVGTFSAAQLAAGGFPIDNSAGSSSVYVKLNSTAAFDAIRFTTGNIAFEVDNLAIAAVPEPGEWAMMLAGLGVVSLIARRRKAQA